MSNLSALLRKLSKVDREALDYALSEGLPFLTYTSETTFLGVNVTDTKEVKVTEMQGVYQMGILNGPDLSIL